MKEEKEFTKKKQSFQSKNSKHTKISLSPKIESVTILSSLLVEITNYAVKCIPREAIGLLGGREIRPKELIIDRTVLVSEGDEISVSFSEEDFIAFEKILEGNSYCVGWWHSHPGYGLFLSQTDISTHIYSFQMHNNQSVALVIEPTKIDGSGRALFQFFQVNGEQGKTPFTYQEIASFIQ
ncbi:MAG: Mov34/MPN/PAD-1 family protein [Candidatus Hodarchaeota archaeon]